MSSIYKGGSKRKFDYDLIILEFTKNKMSKKQIMDKYGIRRSGLDRILRMYLGYKKRSRPSLILTKEFLQEHYIKQRKPAWFIAREIGISSASCVAYAIEKHGLPLRANNKKRFERLRDYKDKNNISPKWKGCGEISGTVLCSIKHGAKIRNLDFDIDVEFLWNLFLKQDRKCAISGIELVFRFKEGKENLSGRTASLDRIDSSKGYTKDNVQWVHKVIQKMKFDLDQDTFLEWVRIIAKNKNFRFQKKR